MVDLWLYVWFSSILVLSGITGESILDDVRAIKKLSSAKEKLTEASKIAGVCALLMAFAPAILLFYVGCFLKQVTDYARSTDDVALATYKVCDGLRETTHLLGTYVRQKQVQVTAQPGAIVVIGDEKNVQQ